MNETRFGFLNEPTILSWSSGKVEPLNGYDELVASMNASQGVYDGWCYPPQCTVLKVSSEMKVPPEVAGCFSLPLTHVLTMSASAPKESKSLAIALLGFMKGRRLQQEGWSHFYKTPMDSKLCDFFADDKAIAWTLDVATEFMALHDSEYIKKQAFGALHWHMFAVNVKLVVACEA